MNALGALWTLLLLRIGQDYDNRLLSCIGCLCRQIVLLHQLDQYVLGKYPIVQRMKFFLDHRPRELPLYAASSPMKHGHTLRRRHFRLHSLQLHPTPRAFLETQVLYTKNITQQT